MSGVRVIFYGGGRSQGKTWKVLRTLVASARAAHAARRFRERDLYCREHDRLWLETFGTTV